MTRVEPLHPPYPSDIQDAFDKIMPPGVPPLLLFRTLARVPRVYHRFRAASLLDRGPLSLREREIAIDRTCALTGCSYEWGVHIAFFAERVNLSEDQIEVLKNPNALQSDSWTSRERVIIGLCDALHHACAIPDALWHEATTHLNTDEILEVIALAGFYRTVTYFANGLDLPAEPGTPEL